MWASVSFQHIVIIFWTLTFWDQMFYFNLHFPSLALESIISSKSPSSFYWKMVLRNQNMGARSVCCYWNITASRPSQQTQLGNIHMYINPLTHISLSILIYLYVNESIQIPQIPIPQDSFYPSYLPSKYLFFSDVEKISSHYPHHIFFFVQFLHRHKVMSELLTQAPVSRRNRCTNHSTMCIFLFAFSLTLYSQTIIFQNHLGCSFLPYPLSVVMLFIWKALKFIFHVLYHFGLSTSQFDLFIRYVKH